ncbi:hypothetical protein NM688_g5975 [Phlebia brevispora]|uniref:Uncharacterized protein n=1 Tax=Phlebia brevispora TaxID=194682 RepID=A0ACC1SLR3_9APHY|nr:hypothetical protein NM688_g5975 [Phlebia brevispora]
MPYAMEDGIPFRTTDPIDPPDLEREVHPLLQKRRRPYTSDEQEQLDQVGPLESLPHHLLPQDTCRPVWQSPIFYYGWELNEEKILQFAKMDGLEVRVQHTWLKSEVPKDIPPEDITPDEHHPENWVSVWSFSRYHTIVNVFATYVKELDIKGRGPSWPIRVVMSPKGTTHIIAFYTNYTTDKAPSSRDLDMLSWAMDEFGMGGELKWWLCATDWDWREPGSRWPDL